MNRIALPPRPRIDAGHLTPRSIAIVGASADQGKIGGRLVTYLGRFGFRGDVVPVNPKAGNIGGYKAVARISDAPDCDWAVLAVPSAAVLEQLRACEEAGVKLAIVTASGLSEGADDGSRAATSEIATIAARGRMRIVGPNAQGLANFATGAVGNFASLFATVAPQDGPVAIVSQSGSISTVLYCALRERGIGVRYSLAPGNQLDVSVPELVDAALDDPAIKIVLVYLESMTKPELLRAAAVRARAGGVRLIVQKAGRTSAGQTAAQSHTGALGSEDRVVDAFLAQCGIWRAYSLQEMLENVPLALQAGSAAGSRLVVVTDSGATAVLAADAAEGAGLPLARLKPATRTALAGVFPDFGSVGNPLDLTSALTTRPDMLDLIIREIEAEDEIDLALFAFPSSPPGEDLVRHAETIRGYAERTGKPVAVAVPQAFNAEPFAHAGLPVYADEERAAAALGRYVGHLEAFRAAEKHTSGAAPIDVVLPAGAEPFLDEAQSLTILDQAGIPTVARKLCLTAGAIEAAYAELGPIVAIKSCSAQVPHKSDHGLVALNLASAEAAIGTARQLWERLGALGHAGVPLLVQRMERRPHEFIVGGRFDPVFGAVAIVGAGGILAEQLEDVAVFVAPFDECAIASKLAELKSARIWRGARGVAPADLAAVASIVARVGGIVEGAGGRIASFDLNPVLVGPPGQAPVVVDALVQRQSGAR